MQVAKEPNQGKPEIEPELFTQTAPGVVVYVWQYSLRLSHWALLISLVVLGVTGYYLHNPLIPGKSSIPFMMGWVRFVHEGAGMIFIVFCLLRFYLFFGGNHWEGWRQILPLRPSQFKEMLEVMKFYAFLRPTSIPRVGHNAAAAGSYMLVYAMAFAEIVTGLVLYNRLRHGAFLNALVGWIPRFVNIEDLRLIHFFLTFAFAAYGIVHVYLCFLNARLEKNGLMDSIFTGYKVIPIDELNEEDRAAVAASQAGRDR
jgi:Ni/Fe-hydrogenase 1 B-type cytochrome subunit